MNIGVAVIEEKTKTEKREREGREEEKEEEREEREERGRKRAKLWYIKAVTCRHVYVYTKAFRLVLGD